MVDWSAHKKAHKIEVCPACGGVMRLGRDTYTCQNKDCGHFEQDPSLHDILERDGGYLRFCQCKYCTSKEQDKGLG
jgi:hypothetical protein